MYMDMPYVRAFFKASGQESTLTKGEAQYNKLLESLHEQRADIGERLDGIS